eukprot:Clim_evm25s3 gene=Clim_evmTU25s3
MTELQTEKSYLKQAPVNLASKKVQFGQTKRADVRWWQNVGLGFKTPRAAIEDDYVDKKCPFTGNVSIRGRILTGIVTKMKMKHTIVIRRDYLHYIKKYNRYEKRHKTLSVHCSPAFKDLRVGDEVVVGQCRPLSKTVRFNVLKVLQTGGGKKQFSKF